MTKASGSVRTVIVDDDPDIQLLARMVIEAANETLTVAGVASTGREALDRCAEWQPTVVVLDYMMPELNGLETARQLRKLRPDVRIVLFSAYLTPTMEAEALELGIEACLNKTEVRQLPALIRQLAAAA